MREAPESRENRKHWQAPLQNYQGRQDSKPMDANPSTAHMFIVNPLSGGTIMSLFSTHPPLEKRIERLMKMKRN